MRRRTSVSHLTYTQAGRYVGVSTSAVTQRVQAGKLPSLDVFGVQMVTTDDCRRWMRERRQAERRPRNATGDV